MYKVLKNLTRMRLTFPKRLLPTRVKSSSGCFFQKSSPFSHKAKDIYLVDEEESSGNDITGNINKYTNRSHTCGELRIDNVGESVTLCGWLEYQRMNKFAIIRDSYGETQLLIKENDKEIQDTLQKLPLESIIEVRGTVLSRPNNMQNKKQQTGEIEVVVNNLQVINKAKDKLPFNIREFQKAKEALRMQYRYLDLRFSFMQRNLRVRSEFLMKMREFLVNNCGFVDVETPTLFKKTPGGAQEFIVPTRFPGQFYSLVQSPQQFKQMLMAGAIDRYFQIARCYRDEGSRSDRQPEFTQLDIEMSFTNLNSIFQLIEELLGYAWPKFLEPLPKKFQHITFVKAMERYGTDQPDVRFEFKLENCTNIVKMNSKLVTSENFEAYYIVFPKEYTNLSKAIKLHLLELSKQYPLAKFIQNKVSTPQDFVAKLTNLLSEPVAAKLSDQIKLSNDSLIFLAYGEKKQTQNLMGKVRVEYVDHLENLGINIRKKGMHLLWVVDMPLFERGESGLQSAHHPFTAPHPEDINLLDSVPLQVRSLAFDLVLNGNEVGGGSVRIHEPYLQEKIFNMLNIDVGKMHHFLDMLFSGCPPHGGVALGIDRLLSKILETSSIRDVIAFPKTFEGRDPLSGAPSPVTEHDQQLYHIKSILPVK